MCLHVGAIAAADPSDRVSWFYKLTVSSLHSQTQSTMSSSLDPADVPPAQSSRSIRRARSANGPSFGVRFRDIWVDDDSSRPRRRAAWDDAAPGTEEQVVLPPAPCQRQDTEEQELLKALEDSRRGFEQAHPHVQSPIRRAQPRKAPKGVLRNKGETHMPNATQPATKPDTNTPLTRNSMPRSFSLPTLFKKETDSAHTRKRWDDPSHPQTRNLQCSLQKPKRKTSNTKPDAPDSTASLTSPVPTPTNRIESCSEASSIDDDQDEEELSITSEGLAPSPLTRRVVMPHASMPHIPSRVPSLIDDDDQKDSQYDQQTKIIEEHVKKWNGSFNTDTMMQQYYYNDGHHGHSDSILGLRFPMSPPSSQRVRHSSPNAVKNSFSKTRWRSQPHMKPHTKTPFPKRNAEPTNGCTGIPAPPRRMASPKASKARRKSRSAPHLQPIHPRKASLKSSTSSFTRTDISGELTNPTDETLSLSSKQGSRKLSPLQRVYTVATDVDLKWAQESVDMVRQRRADAQTYTEPLKMSSEIGSSREPCYYYLDELDAKSNTEYDNDDKQLALVMYPESVGECFEQLVTASHEVSPDDFWRRYFWRCSEKRVWKSLRDAVRNQHCLEEMEQPGADNSSSSSSSR